MWPIIFLSCEIQDYSFLDFILFIRMREDLRNLLSFKMSNWCLEQSHTQSSHTQTGWRAGLPLPTPSAKAALTGLFHSCSCTALSLDLALGVATSACPQPPPQHRTVHSWRIKSGPHSPHLTFCILLYFQFKWKQFFSYWLGLKQFPLCHHNSATYR